MALNETIMQLKKLKSLIKQGESDTLEFKTSTGQLHTAMKTICAFLNQNGGIVLFGVNNEGKIIGQEVSDKTLRLIANEMERIDPHAEIKIDKIPVGSGNRVIALTIEEGKNKPYTYDDRPYIRSQSTTQKMSRDDYAQLIQENPRLSPSWDIQTTNDCTINDLDKNRIHEVVQVGMLSRRLTEIANKSSVPVILKKLKLMRDDRLTNAAVVLFCKKEIKQFTQSEIKLARFLGHDKSEFLDNKIYRGNIFDLLEKAMAFLTLHLPIAGKIEEGKIRRTDTPAIPFKVLREALVNALCHRDYSMRSGDVSVAIYDDRVEIISAGRLPSEIKLSALTKEHESHPRNKLIADIFFFANMIERWGRGTLDMISMCKQANIPVPRYDESTSSFYVTFPFKEALRKFEQAKPPTLYGKLSARQKEILEIINSGPLSTEAISQEMTNPPTIRMLQMELSQLKQLGFIRHADKSRGRTVRWVINAK